MIMFSHSHHRWKDGQARLSNSEHPRWWSEKWFILHSPCPTQQAQTSRELQRVQQDPSPVKVNAFCYRLQVAGNRGTGGAENVPAGIQIRRDLNRKLFRVREPQVHEGPAALAGDRSEAHAAVHTFHDLPNDGQTNAGSFVVHLRRKDGRAP
jgi:hypothetical protein